MKKITLAVLALYLVLPLASADVSLTFGEGINMVGIPMTQSQIEDAGCEIEKFSIIKHETDKILTYDPTTNWASASSMRVGRGYYINIKKTCTVDFPAFDLDENKEYSDQNIHKLSEVNINLKKGANFISSPVEVSQEQLQGACGTEDGDEIGSFGGISGGKLVTIEGGKFVGKTSMSPYLGYWVWYNGDSCNVKLNEILGLEEEEKEETEKITETAPLTYGTQSVASCSYGWASDSTPVNFHGVKVYALSNTKSSGNQEVATIKVVDAAGNEQTKEIEKGVQYLKDEVGTFMQNIKGVGKFEDVVIDTTSGATRRIFVYPDKARRDAQTGEETKLVENSRLIVGDYFLDCGAAISDTESDTANGLSLTVVGSGQTNNGAPTFKANEKVKVSGTLAPNLHARTSKVITFQVYRGIVTPSDKTGGRLVAIGQTHVDDKDPSKDDVGSDGKWEWEFGLGKGYFQPVAYTVIANSIANGVDLRAYYYLQGTQ